MEENKGLVYIGKMISMDSIEGADFIVCATVVCGKGGKWRGVVRKSDFGCGDLCIVYLPDSLVPKTPEMKFMSSTNWRVKMRRFKGAPSEVVIMPFCFISMPILPAIGEDLTDWFGVTKYHKPIPANLQCDAKGCFPGFVPKTDEPNYQREPELVDLLHGQPYYITEKCDGSSTTAFKYKGEFGVCSRNWELKPKEDNGYWKIAYQYDLPNVLPEGYALQWETCGPKIQSNPMGLKVICAFAFSAYNILEQRYLTGREFISFCEEIQFPTVRMLKFGSNFDKSLVDGLGAGLYINGMQREGVIVRSDLNILGHKPISFKVINLDYDK
jgi:RNA ligase (TIGR02306 family)